MVEVIMFAITVLDADRSVKIYPPEHRSTKLIEQLAVMLPSIYFSHDFGSIAGFIF